MHPSTLSNHNRGSALISVVVFTTVALVLVASLLSWSSTERKLNYRNALRLEARNAAEAVAEYGFSQIRQKMENRSTVSLDPDGPDALVKPPAGFWTGGNIDTSDIELIGGTLVQVPLGSDYYYEPSDINNESDPLKGKYVFRRDIRVIAKATVRPSSVFGAPITSYVSQRISVRGAPLFAHAIFYNMDLEIFNGPNMTISGPVHTNGSLYLYPGNGATLTFTDQVTATGRVYHGAKPGDGTSDGSGAAARTGDVKINSKTNTAGLAMKVDGVWKDSSQGAGTSASDWTGFRDYASQRWNGNLQTNAHGVENYTPVAVSKYAEDPSPSNGIDNSVNSGRTLIEPSSYPSVGDPDYKQKLAIEEQKYANHAGIYITVNPSTKSITLTSRNKNDTAKNTVLSLPASGNLVKYKAYKATSTYSTTNTVKNYEITDTRTKNGVTENKYRLKTTTTVTPATITYTSAGAVTTTGTPSTGTPTTGSESGWRTTPPGSNSNTSTSTTPTAPAFAGEGMYDQHRQKGVDLVEIDMDALRLAVASMAGNPTAKISTGANKAVAASDAIGGLTEDDWTGIVYVEVQGGPTTDPITGITNAATNPASMQTSVRIINGKGKVASYVGKNSSEGLTIATNAPVYVKGNYNADGTVSTSSPNSATTPETGEVPAAIVGDAITILSENFNDTASLTTLKQNTATANIEIAAALLVGLTPTNKNGTGRSSGGAHNLPRFLENWDTKNTFIRGSLVALFESRVFTEPHGTSDYYSPPNRNWGFNSMFREGRYPPGTPRVMSYRRVDFTDMTAAEYETAKASFGW